MKRALFAASVVGHVSAFHLPYLEWFKDRGFQVDVAAKDNRELPFEYNTYNIPFERSPFKKSNIIAYKQLKELINHNEYDIIHCHTPVAAFLTRFVARKARKHGTKVIYTAHGFHFFKGAPLRNWLLYFPVEWICSFFTDVLITINKEDYAFAKKHMHAKRVEYVPGVGVDIDKFMFSPVSSKDKREELNIPENATVLLSVGEVNENKNQEVIIRAISKIHDDSLYYIIAGKGDREENLKKLAERLDLKDRVIFLGYRNDIRELHEASDVFCFPSKREGLPVALIEAMASGMPVVCSEIRGNVDLIENGNGGYLCKPNDVDGFTDALNKLISSPELCKKIGMNNRNIVQKYDKKTVVEIVGEIYLEELNEQNREPFSNINK